MGANRERIDVVISRDRNKILFTIKILTIVRNVGLDNRSLGKAVTLIIDLYESTRRMFFDREHFLLEKLKKSVDFLFILCYYEYAFRKGRQQNGGLAQLARASALHAEGRGFESHILHHFDDNR